LKIVGGTNICEEPVSNIVYTGVARAKLTYDTPDPNDIACMEADQKKSLLIVIV